MDPYGYGPDDEAAAAGYSPEALKIAQAMAQFKMRQAQNMMNTPTAAGATVGRTYVAASPLEHLVNAMTRVKGGMDMRNAEQGYQPLMQQAQAGEAARFRLGRADKNREFGLQQQQMDLQNARAMSAEAEAAAQAKARDAAQAETARHNQAVEGLTRGAQAQDSWMAVPDASGGIVMFNKKTGEYRPLAPQGGSLTGRAPPYPGKPVQMENDVQALGKDVEPISKARPDIDALKTATEKGDVAGFGPVAGRVPNVLTSAEGLANRQAAGRLMAAIIQATSGQAASEKEVDRLLEANGMGRTATDDQLKLGVAKLDAQYQNLLRQREAKYHPQVVETYGQRGGFTSHSAPPDAGQGTVRVTSKAERDALPSGAQYVGPDGKTYTKR